MNRASRPSPAPLSFRPLYLQIKDLLVAALAEGKWRPGEAIPSEMLLAARYGVAQGTVRKAIDAMAGDNLVVRRQGKGTFVATHTEEAASTVRFLRIRRDDGGDEYPGSRVVGLRRARAGAETAKLLAMRVGDPLIQIQRVLEWGGKAVVHDDIVLPAALFRGLTRAKLVNYPGSMYGFFETQFGVRMLHAEERIKAVAADAVVAGALGVPIGAPLLAVERVTYTFGGRPVEFRRGLCVTLAHHYANAIG